ncbi:hypothetical protein [Bernardetia sp.]|uniref:hypothetical protein n=1 Tax=Bernardetia sp. TaxID=1937974 RepID=UPI0025C1C655|nr:hypothetical protein [Bernardetia sp.]
MDNPFIAYYHFKKCAAELNSVVTTIEEEVEAEKEAKKPKRSSYLSTEDEDEDVENDYEELGHDKSEDYNFFEIMFQKYQLSDDVKNSLKLFYGKTAMRRVTSKIATLLAEEFESQQVKEGERISELLEDLQVGEF